MRLTLLTALAMIAFAANSLANRYALLDGAAGPADFASLRAFSGVVVLFVLVVWRNGGLPRITRLRPAAVLGLTTYLLGFSFAYVSLDAGLGALVLFGLVQVTMFAGALIEGERPPPLRWLGMALALAGLALLTRPGASGAAPVPLLLMGIAAIGWGVYSLVGRNAGEPVAATLWNFVYALPVVAAAPLLWPDQVSLTLAGAIAAIVSGGLFSALGYALWYSLLPTLGATRAALAQLSVPAIALALGSLLLGEAVTLSALLSAGLILAGIALGLMPRREGG